MTKEQSPAEGPVAGFTMMIWRNVLLEQNYCAIWGNYLQFVKLGSNICAGGCEHIGPVERSNAENT